MSLVPWYETHYMIVTIMFKIILEIQCIKNMFLITYLVDEIG